MKFHCDRCKTRYSIGDDRVRGKILKIRCKNCSAVITVREEMAGDGEAEAASKKPEPPDRPAKPEKEAAAGASALRGAFHQVFERPMDSGDEPSPSPSDSFRAAPPDHFDQEWYVAIEGEQEGPFPLEAAKGWVANQGRDVEIFCWNEDFDDWLPVEKVSHFRGLRARSQSAPAVTPAPAKATAPPPVDEPPLAHSALAAVAAEADSGVFRGPDILSEETPKPLFAPTFAALEAEQKGRQEASGQELGDQEAEAVPESAAKNPSGGAIASAKPGLGLGAAAPGADLRAASPVSAAIEAAGPVESIADPAAVEGAAPADGEQAAERADSDFDLDIGEASRVVKVPMLADAPGRSSEPSEGGLPGVSKIRKGSALGAGTGAESAIPALAPLSEEALAEARPGVLSPGAHKRRANLVLPIVIGVAVIAVVLGVLFALMREGDEEGPLARSKLAGDELAHRPGGPERVRVVTREADKPEDEKPPRTPRNNHRTKNGSTATVDGGARESAGGDESLRPLSPADVIRASRENGLGNKRCYEHALKKDPFLDVKKIKVTVTVSPGGVVTDLKMDSYANTLLGQCLASRIRKWAFRKSPKGITTELTLSFEQM